MKIRTCPNCNYKYSFFIYVKKMTFKLIDSKWNCENCGAELSFNIGRRTLVTIIAMFPMVFSEKIANFLKEFGFSSGMSWLFVILMMLIWIIWIISYDTFTLIKKK